MTQMIAASEDRLVAELEILGVRYLSRQMTVQVRRARSAPRLLADLVRQPSGRVRAALISLLLAHPDYGRFAPVALRPLTSEQQWTLKLFYTAAVLLQKEYAPRLQKYLDVEWRWLPDWFSAELDLPPSAPAEQLRALARLHQQKTGMTLNWVGTYDNAARCLLRRWELEQRWSQ